MKVNLRKREEGGFINPAREKWNRRIGIVVLTGLTVLFVYLLVWVCADPHPAADFYPAGDLRVSESETNCNFA